MLDILKSLEPLRVPKDTILFNELEDINEGFDSDEDSDESESE